MARNIVFSKIMIVLWISTIVLTQAQAHPGIFKAPKYLALKFSRDPQTLSLASTDYGNIVHKTPWAVFEPCSVSDISDLISFSCSLRNPFTQSATAFTIAIRGQAHSVYGQSLTQDGVVLNMTHLNNFKNGLGIVVSCDGKSPLGCYADVGGEQRWIDVLNATLKYGLTPQSWTDYLYLSIGCTLSNAGISGRTFRFGPQISNVLELDFITGKGNLVTCSPEQNSEAFYAVLGGLGQFGVITRARIPLGPAPTRAYLLRLLYNDFTAFSRDQEHLISFNALDYIEGQLLLDQPQQDFSFYPTSERPRISSLVSQYGIIYVLQLAKFYDNNSKAHVKQEVVNLARGLNYTPTFMFENNESYEEFLDTAHAELQAARSLGFVNNPNPWLNMFVPRSRILDFNEGVFKGILLKENITVGSCLVYPMNKNKWDDRMSVVIPDEDVFYAVNLFHFAIGLEEQKKYQAQNQRILKFCKDVGINIKEYLIGDKTHQEWVEHFGQKWKLFQDRKAEFDPKRILSPGLGIFK